MTNSIKIFVKEDYTIHGYSVGNSHQSLVLSKNKIYTVEPIEISNTSKNDKRIEAIITRGFSRFFINTKVLIRLLIHPNIILCK